MSLENFTNRVLQTSLRVSTGAIDNGNCIFNGDLPKITVIAKPASNWAQAVDAIETPFADSYDKEEYEQNMALSLMGFYELRAMLKAFGVSTALQTDYEKKPLAGKQFLVAGCGPGREVVSLSALGAGVIGIDATLRYAEIAANKIKRASEILGCPLESELYQCPIEKYPFPENKFDGISSLFGVINHVQDWEQALAKMEKSLKPEGRLVVEKYGSDKALVFKLVAQGKLSYQPSILQRRDPQGKGILLGESAEILPASFPDDDTFRRRLFDANLEPTEIIGYLRIAALFPREPNEKNIAQFMDLVGQIDKKAWSFINRFRTPQEKLFSAFVYDLVSQRRKQDAPKIEDFAYVWYSATKRT